MQDRDDNRFDLDLKAIMDEGQEEVPAHVWNNLEPRLDIMAEERRKVLFLRWMRYTTAAVSAAAVIAIALIFPWGSGIKAPSVPKDGIAVMEPVVETAPEEKYIALAAETSEQATVKPSAKKESFPSEIPSSIEDAYRTTEEDTENKHNAPEETNEETNEETIAPEKTLIVTDFDEPGEEETRRNRIKTSITMSGNALSNSKTKGSRAMSLEMKAPELPRKNEINEISSSTYGIPISFGIGARVAFTPRWSISAGINYTLLTRNFRGTYTNKDGMLTPETSIVNNQSYIGIPVNVYFNIVNGNFVDFYAYAGGTMEKCIENKFLLKDMNPDIIRKKTAGLQWSANVGLGVEFILTDWLGLYIDPSLRYYFKGNQPKSIRTQQPLSMGLELGFRVRL